MTLSAESCSTPPYEQTSPFVASRVNWDCAAAPPLVPLFCRARTPSAPPDYAHGCERCGASWGERPFETQRTLIEREECGVASKSHVLARAVPHAPLPHNVFPRLGKLVAKDFDAEILCVGRLRRASGSARFFGSGTTERGHYARGAT
eukprot:CAMPEP_0119074586 /NCGR_PEP_ID=MMETSP1178-20130426/72201_1 /TAXON_ID=33656 /ORGANISM="unid sp, Strain CCMP2000" /LENGTH=147 /DNA_ID=CAMNT_0007056753 /DNA_START=12 /DNA_END=456 /DNA_ORIENTATION=+